MSSYSQLHSWVFHANPQSNADLRLFCLPYAGGGASLYRSWGRTLSPNIDVCPIQLPGRENRGLEAPISDLKEVVQTLAKLLLPLLNKPFALFGHSMGALLCYELAQEVNKLYNMSPEHLFVSGCTAPHLRGKERAVHLLPEEEFIKELRSLNGTPEELLQNDELMNILLPRLRADFSICETYTSDIPLNCPVSVFGGMKDFGVDKAGLEGWKARVNGEFKLRMFEGDHFFIHEEHEAIKACVMSDLTASRSLILTR